MLISIGSRTEQRDTAPSLSTLGRLGGLSAAEADRGERALWLAGNGFRAALFHLGALTRLNELGLLAQVRTVGAVSGGSILAALLATRVTWPLHGAYREWREQVVLPLRGIARRNVRARALLRQPFPGAAAVLEESYARELVEELGGESRWGPNFVFGASGLTLGGLAAGWEECVEWEIDRAAHPPGYHPALVEKKIAAVRTDLDAFGEAEQAVLENHGYLLADTALRARGLVDLSGIEGLPPQPPHPRWMDEERVREALSDSSRRKVVGRLRARRARRAGRGAGEEEEVVDGRELLERHRPLLRYDSLESLRADPVSSICTFTAPGRCNSLHRADGSLIASVEPRQGEARLSLEFLGGILYANGEVPRRGDYLDACGGSHAADALELRDHQDGGDIVYGRARRDGEGRLWLQYWSFFYYVDRGFLGLGQHEGDWQVFQIRVDAQGRPDGPPSPATPTSTASAGSRSSWLGAKTGRWRWSGPRVARTLLCPAPAASRRQSSPTTTTGAAPWSARGSRRSGKTAPAGSSGRDAGARPGGASTSKARVREGRGTIPAGATRGSCIAKDGLGTSPRGQAISAATALQPSPYKRAARLTWRSSPTGSPMQAAPGRSRRELSPRRWRQTARWALPAPLRSTDARARSRSSSRPAASGAASAPAPSPRSASPASAGTPRSPRRSRERAG
jgi:hypothetical protein